MILFMFKVFCGDNFNLKFEFNIFLFLKNTVYLNFDLIEY